MTSNRRKARLATLAGALVAGCLISASTQARADSGAQVELLGQLNFQLAALRAELLQMQASVAAVHVALEEQREELQRSVVALIGIQQRLAYGDSDVLEDLDAATPALPFPAQQIVQTARAALEREDLSYARYSLSFAIVLSQRTQLAP